MIPFAARWNVPRSLRLATLLTVCLLGPPLLVAQDAPSAPSQEASEAPARPAGDTASLDGLSWLTGDWVGTMNGSTIEEVWSLPAAGTLMGMFRWHDGTTVRLFEFMSIELGSDGAVLHLRHFGRGLDAWEKDGPLVLPQVEAGPERIVFRSETRDENGKTDITRLTYARRGSQLTVTLGKSDGSGQDERRSVFTYELRQAEPEPNAD